MRELDSGELSVPVSGDDGGERIAGAPGMSAAGAPPGVMGSEPHAVRKVGQPSDSSSEPTVRAASGEAELPSVLSAARASAPRALSRSTSTEKSCWHIESASTTSPPMSARPCASQ